LLVYEGQPFHNFIIDNIKKNFFEYNIKTIGYVHPFPVGIATNYIYKSSSPDKIIVNGIDLKNFFLKYLGWPKKKIQVLESARFTKEDKKMSGFIYLPIHIGSVNFILKQFIELTKLNKEILNYNFIIKNHPQSLKSKKHLKLIHELKKLINKNYVSTLENKISIFIGASGAVIEALERNIKVFHITINPELEMYNEFFFKNLKTITINKFIFCYILKKKKKLIIFGKKNKSFFKYLKI